MKKTINFYDFENEFIAMSREDSFSYDGKRALFDYLEEYEDSTGEELELDIIALCCEFTEDSIQNIAENYSIEGDREEILDHLNDHTMVIEVDDENVIIQDY